jgi:hypothetical protein
MQAIKINSNGGPPKFVNNIQIDSSKAESFIHHIKFQSPVNLEE